MKRTSFLLFLFLLLTAWPAVASQRVDDLLQRFRREETVGVANQFFEQLRKEEFLDEPVRMAASAPKDTLRAQVWYWAGEYYYDQQDYTTAIDCLNKALPLLHNGADRTTEADCLNLLGVIYIRLSDYDNAARYALQCYKLDEQSGDPDRMSSSLNTLAAIYMSARQPEEAEKYILKGIAEAEKAENPARMAVLQGMASEVYHSLGNDEEALRHVNEAYRLDSLGGREDRAMVRLAQKASVLLGLHRWAEAERLLKQVIPFFRQTDDRHSLAIALNKMGMALYSQNRAADAVGYYREAAQLFEKMGDMANEIHARRGLYESLWESDPQAAKAELDRFNALKDSLYNNVSAEKLARYNAEFGNDWLKVENHAQRRAKWWALLLAAVAVAGGVGVWWLMRRRHIRQQQVNEQLSTDISRLREQYRELNMRYDNALATRPAGNSVEMNPTDRDFMERTVETISSLIADGQVDGATVASRMGMSLFQLRQRLTALTGETPQSFIQLVRMRRARYLLDNHPELNITEVAQLCAYTETPNFTRAFKKAFGVTPTQYAERQAGS